ncbi:MAG: hypothetical protein ACI9V8_001961 [Urechidicola sp.]
MTNPNALFHFVTGLNFEGSTAGVSYLGVNCAEGFATDSCGDRLALTAVVIAHKLGHNFGANHVDLNAGGGSDSNPGAFNFTVQTGVAKNLSIIFNPITISDIDVAASVRVRHTSASTNRPTTRSFSFNDIDNVALETIQASNGVTILGIDTASLRISLRSSRPITRRSAITAVVRSFSKLRSELSAIVFLLAKPCSSNAFDGSQ